MAASAMPCPMVRRMKTISSDRVLLTSDPVASPRFVLVSRTKGVDGVFQLLPLHLSICVSDFGIEVLSRHAVR